MALLRSVFQITIGCSNLFLQRLDEFVDLNCTPILFEKGTIRICINQAVYWNARAVNIFMGPLADPCRTPGD